MLALFIYFFNKIFRVFILFFRRSCFAESAMELTATQVAPKFRQWLRLSFARKLPICGLTELVSSKSTCVLLHRKRRSQNLDLLFLLRNPMCVISKIFGDGRFLSISQVLLSSARLICVITLTAREFNDLELER